MCKDHDYGYTETPNENNKILKHNPGEKSVKAPNIIYFDLNSLLEKISTCHNNPKKLSTTKIDKHTAAGYSFFTRYSFDATKIRLDYFRGHKCVKKFCKDLKEHATNIINYEKKEMIPLTDEENESYLKEEVCHVCKKRIYF